MEGDRDGEGDLFVYMCKFLQVLTIWLSLGKDLAHGSIWQKKQNMQN